MLEAVDTKIQFLDVYFVLIWEIFKISRAKSEGNGLHKTAGRRIGIKLFGHHPTLPSRLMPISFCASTANSIGSSCSTSLTKPLTISAIASSCGTPRCIT